jgi:hypothetical protein
MSDLQDSKSEPARLSVVCSPTVGIPNRRQTNGAIPQKIKRHQPENRATTQDTEEYATRR